MIELLDTLNKNGEYSGAVASREECHKTGLWHKAVAVFILSNNNNMVLLQQRSNTKKLYPNFWDIIGGHVLTGEFGYHATMRELKEELGVSLSERDLCFIRTVTSEYSQCRVINRQFNEFFVAYLNTNIRDKMILQIGEVSAIKWFKKEEILAKIRSNYETLTPKYGCWKYLIKYFEFTK